MFNKLREQLKVMFEGDRCKFNKRCKLYKKDSATCNNWYERFPTYDRAYCGKYRSLDE